MCWTWWRAGSNRPKNNIQRGSCRIELVTVYLFPLFCHLIVKITYWTLYFPTKCPQKQTRSSWTTFRHASWSVSVNMYVVWHYSNSSACPWCSIQVFPEAFISKNPQIFLDNKWINIEELRLFMASPEIRSTDTPAEVLGQSQAKGEITCFISCCWCLMN